MDKTKHREQVKMSAHLGKLEFANQALHQTPDSPAVPAGAGGGAGELVVGRATSISIYWQELKRARLIDSDGSLQ